MRGRRSAVVVAIDADTRATLESWVRSSTTPNGRSRRARAILLLAQGERLIHVAVQVGLAERHVRKWAKRFCAQGLDGLYDAARPGRPPVFPPGGRAARGQGGV